MIGYLKGHVFQIYAERLLLLVHEVGYGVMIHGRALSTLSIGKEIELWIEPIAHEGQTSLFGFLQAAEHQWFCWLIQVPGVGGRVAQNILSLYEPHDLRHIILNHDIAHLKAAGGVGMKLAGRIVHELQGRALKWQEARMGHPSESTADLLLALCALGYKHAEAHQALMRAQELSPQAETQELLKKSLHLLANPHVAS